MNEVLEEHFPTYIANRIMRCHSHPTADMMMDLIVKYKHHEPCCELLELAHYEKYNSCIDWSCRWSRKLYGCGCRICKGIREARLSKPK